MKKIFFFYYHIMVFINNNLPWFKKQILINIDKFYVIA